MKRSFFLLCIKLILFVLLPALGFAQKKPQFGFDRAPDPKALSFYEKGDEALRNREFAKALTSFKKAIKKDSSFAEAYLQVAGILELAANGPRIDGVPREDYLVYYSKYVDIAGVNSNSYSVILKTGSLYLDRGEYSKAERLLQKVAGKVGGDAFYEHQKQLAICQFAKEALQKPVDIKSLMRLPNTVNRFQSQYFPSITADGLQLFYTAVLPINSNVRYQEDIYFSQYKEGQWSQGEPVSSNINTPDNEGTCSISGDGKTLVFTACNNVGRGMSDCNLFISKKINNKWSKPKPLCESINTRYWESQPSLSSDGRWLFFVSTRPDGIGKKDIWLSRLHEDGSCEPPTNLGDGVNTKDDEVSPFIHANNTTLYFSSNGHIGMGKFDLFLTESQKQGLWSEPKNLGYPINTHHDEVAFVVDHAGEMAYFTKDSVIESQRKSAIFELKLPLEIKPAHRTYFIKGKIKDSLNGQPIAANVELIRNNDNQVINSILTDRENGEYLVSMPEGGEYAFYVQADNYLFKSRHFEVNKDHSKDLILDIELIPLQVGSVSRLDNIFFEVNKYDLLPTSETELQKMVVLLQQNPKIKIEIAGHTDNTGKPSYNLELSKQRAESVKKYLISKGIAQERMVAMGYGETQPIATNSTEEGKSLNRRIEVVIR